MPLNCGAGEDSWKSFGQQGDQTSQLKENQHWIFIVRADTEAEVPVFWSSDVNRWLIGKVPGAGKDWGQKEKRALEDDWMASPMQWTWALASSGRWWGTGRPGVLLSTELQRVGHEWATEQQELLAVVQCLQVVGPRSFLLLWLEVAAWGVTRALLQQTHKSRQDTEGEGAGSRVWKQQPATPCGLTLSCERPQWCRWAGHLFLF